MESAGCKGPVLEVSWELLPLPPASHDRGWSEHAGHAGVLGAVVLNKHFCSEGFSY